MTVEGEDDDVAAPGQTRRAHDLCPLVPADARRQLVVPACGHFSLFPWRRLAHPRSTGGAGLHGPIWPHRDRALSLTPSESLDHPDITRTGSLLCVRTLFVSLPSTTAETPALPCEAMTIRCATFLLCRLKDRLPRPVVLDVDRLAANPGCRRSLGRNVETSHGVILGILLELFIGDGCQRGPRGRPAGSAQLP